MDSSEVRLGRLAGFDMYVQPLGLLILAVFSLTMAGGLLQGLISFAAIVVAVTSHELGHAYVARRRGMWVQRIVLHAFGGVTYWTGRGASGGTWKDRLWITAAGPAVNLAFAAIFYVLYVSLVSVLPFEVSAILHWFFLFNFLLGVFNLLPVYPLDGGVILHTMVSAKYGSRPASVAYLIGVGGAVLMALFGLLTRAPILAVFGVLFGWQNWQKWKQESPPGGFAALRADWEDRKERDWLRRNRSEVDAALRQSLEQGIQSLSSRQKDLLRRARRYDQWRN